MVNALFQIDDAVYSPTNAQPLYKLIMTAAERAELAAIPSQSTLQGPNSQMNATFISASNQLGEFRAGATAALLGAVGSALVGGVGTLIVVALWIRLFPQLARRDKLVP